MRPALVYECTEHVTMYLSTNNLDSALSNLNRHHTGYTEVNTIDPDSGEIITRNDIDEESLSNLKEAQYRIRGSTSVKVKVKVFSDGSKTLEIL